MCRSTTNNVFFASILLIFTAVNVVRSCGYSEQTCYQGLSTWCCAYDDTCGSYRGTCDSSSTLPSSVIAIIIVVSVFCFVTCLSCCIQSHQRQQRLQASIANSNGRMVRHPYQQQTARGPVRIVRVRPVSHVGGAPPVRAFPSIYEAPPPPYEVACAISPSIHQSSSSPPVTATVEQSNSTVL